MVDALARGLLRCAAAGFRVFARLVHPVVVGAAVVVWRGDEILVVTPSYRRWETIPGGRVGRRESPRHAAARELREEAGLDVDDASLQSLGVRRVDHSDTEDHVHFFACRLPEGQTVRVDQREIVRARFAAPATLRDVRCWPPLTVLLERGIEPL